MKDITKKQRPENFTVDQIQYPKKKWLGKLNRSPARMRRDIVNQCLKIWSNIVSLAAGGSCQHCGKPGQSSHHIINRGNAVGWHWFEVSNGIRLCTHCHLFLAHSHDYEVQKQFHDWIVNWLEGKGLDYDIMIKKYRAIGKISTSDLPIVGIFLNEELLKLESKVKNGGVS